MTCPPTRWSLLIALLLGAAGPAVAQTPTAAGEPAAPSGQPASAVPAQPAAQPAAKAVDEPGGADADLDADPDLDAESDVAEDHDRDRDPDLAASRTRMLGALAARIGEIEDDIAVARGELRRAPTSEERGQIEANISGFEGQLDSLRRSFRGLAAGVDLDAIRDSPDKEIKWDSEASELLKPILRELRDATQRPREVEKYRLRIVHFEERVPKVDRALARVTQTIAATAPGQQRRELKRTRADLVELRRELSDQLDLARAKPAELEQGRESLVESASNILSGFFRSRGMNLMMAFAAFVGVFLLLRLVHRLITVRMQRRNDGLSSVGMRIFDLIAYAGTAIVAVFSMLALLYSAGDWVLLSLIVLMLAGILWSARNWVPQLWEEIKLLLDIGAVRQGERVVFGDVPWRIERLQLVSVLANPAFPNTVLRLPLRALVELHSRPCAEGEPWFPCSVGDWVTLDGELAVHVVSISPESVSVREGRMTQTFTTPDFLAAAPTNLSTGFRHRRVMRFDYSLQAQVTHEIPEQLDAILRAELATDPMGSHLEALDVGFDAATPSSAGGTSRRRRASTI